MRKHISGAHPDLNDNLLKRWKERQRASRNLGFRFEGKPIKPHGVRRIWRRKDLRFPKSGKCMVCGQDAHACICRIEILDSNGKHIGYFEQAQAHHNPKTPKGLPAYCGGKKCLD